MDFLTVNEEKLSVNAATVPEKHKITAKTNKSLLYNRNYRKLGRVPLHETYIFRNGYLNQSLLAPNGTFYGTNEFRLLVNISAYEGYETGEYFVITYVDSFSLLYALRCSSPLPFVFVGSYSAISSLIWYVQMLEIHTTGKILL